MKRIRIVLIGIALVFWATAVFDPTCESFRYPCPVPTPLNFDRLTVGAIDASAIVVVDLSKQ